MTSDAFPPTVSVIIATYNRAQYLAQCLDSVLAQTRPPEEIVVVDDGSTDDTPIVAQRYADHIRYKRQENQGKSVALNNAIPEAVGTHVCVFDDDDVMLPDALARHHAYLRAHPDIDYTYSGKYYFDDYPGQTLGIWERSEWRVGQLDACSPEELLIKTMEWNGTLMQGMLVPVRCLTEVGLFDASMLRTQDYDMMLKLARRFRGASIDAITFVHRNHGGARGPGASLHDEQMRHAVWHEYDRKLFRRVRSELRLAEYLPRNTGTDIEDNLDTEKEFDALYQRAVVMFKRGLFAEAGEDVRLILGRRSLDADALQRLGTLVETHANIGVPDYVAGAPDLADELAAAPGDKQSLVVRRAAIRGLYWGLRGAIRRRKPNHIYYFAKALVRLVPASATWPLVSRQFLISR